MKSRAMSWVAAAVCLALQWAVCGHAQLVINEIDYDQPGISDGAEFVEIKNTGSTPVLLSSFALELVEGSGGGAQVYETIDLPAESLAAGDYFVVCGDAALVANCDLDVEPDVNLINNGAPDAVALTSDGSIVDTVSYEGDTEAPYTEGSGDGLEDSFTEDDSSISRFPDGVDTDQNNVDLGARLATPGATNSGAGLDCPNDGGQSVEIWEIQGAGAVAACDGETVTTEGNVVTVVGPEGFYMQTPESRSDDDPLTSDGIYVFTFDAPEVDVGDDVDVTGDVSEFFDLTEISFATVTVGATGLPLPAPMLLDASFPSQEPQAVPELERVEGMLVRAEGPSVGPSDNFGDVPMLARFGRAFREPGIEFPGIPGLPIWDGNPEVFEIDPDGLSLPDAVINTFQRIRAEGAMTFAFGDYQILPTSYALGPEPEVARAVRDRLPGEMTIGTLNLFRLPAGDDVRRTKVAQYITELMRGPDAVVVQEIDNIDVLEDLAARIAELIPPLDYEAHLIEGNDIGGIDIGYLTRRDTITVDSVTQFGADTIFTFDGSLLNDRPPLVMEATYTGAGGPFEFTMIGVHQRSLSGIDDPDGGTRVKTKRFEQAVNLSEFMQELQTADPTRPIVVTGDFNAFEFTDGYVDVMGQLTGNLDPLGDEFPTFDAIDPDFINQVFNTPEEDRYSFIFSGSSQVLDHMLTSAAMEPFVVGINYTRGNADASSLFLNDADAGPIRSSDHDGLVLYVRPAGVGDLTLATSGACPGEVTMTVSGGTPGAVAGVIFSNASGSDPLGAGPCEGTPSQLSDPQLLTLVTFDGAGELSVTREAPGQACGVLMQVVDGAACALSNVDSF